VAVNKVKRFRDQDYWGLPVPGFGDNNARLLIIGLAPAAHGANRTGRMFTGDSSGDWLSRAMFETGFANQPTSISKDDGLVLKDAYITAIARCAPPKNKPTSQEIQNCSVYLKQEIKILKNVKVVLCLGAIAFNTYLGINSMEKLKFSHGAIYKINDNKVLMASYHPSRQNTQTGRLKWEEWIKVFETAKKIIQYR